MDFREFKHTFDTTPPENKLDMLKALLQLTIESIDYDDEVEKAEFITNLNASKLLIESILDDLKMLK